MAERWAQAEEVTLRGEQPIAGGGNLMILLEKDSVCLTPREGEDDSDAFPNPGATGGRFCYCPVALEFTGALYLSRFRQHWYLGGTIVGCFR